MATVYDIIQGISQAAANAYDGSQYENYSYDGEARTSGLKREKGDPIIDSRVMDGFKVKISGPKLFINYQSEVPLSDFHNTKLDQEMEQVLNDMDRARQARDYAKMGELFTHLNRLGLEVAKLQGLMNPEDKL